MMDVEPGWPLWCSDPTWGLFLAVWAFPKVLSSPLFASQTQVCRSHPPFEIIPPHSPGLPGRNSSRFLTRFGCAVKTPFLVFSALQCKQAVQLVEDFLQRA